MSSGGGGGTPQQVVTTQNRDPWSGAQPYLQNIMSTAQSNFYNGVGAGVYGGPTQAAIEFPLQNALDRTAGLAADPNNMAGINNARDLSNQIVQSQGMTPGIQGAVGGLGQVGDIYGNIAGLQGGLNQNQYNALSGLDTSYNLYGNMYGQADQQQNPYLQNILDTQGRKIADQVNSNMSGAGRYGSGAHTNVLSRNLAEAADPILAQDYQNRQAQKMQALAGMAGVSGQKFGALQQGIGNQFMGAQGMGQTQQAIADLYGQGLNRSGQYSQLMPQLNEARYADADRLMGLGNFYQNRAQNETQRQIDYFNAIQASPSEALARFSALTNGAGGLGGTTVTSAPNVNAPQGGLAGGLGGALAGGSIGSIFGPVGAGIGALGGGLLGYLR